MSSVRTKFKRSIIGIMSISAIALLLPAGCVGYRIGSTLPPGINVINIPTFINKTSEPRLEIETTQAAIREVQRDGTLSISDFDKSDIVLHATLVDFKLEPLRYESDRSTTTREYRLTITAELTVTQRLTQEVLTRNTVQGETDFIPTGDLSSAKREALPAAAKDLAHDIIESIVEYW